jgi:N utilization substance protein B
MALHAARRVALQMIFARMFSTGDCSSVLEDQQDMLGIQEDQGFIDGALQGVSEHEEEFQQIIQSLSPQRALERIPVLARAILYLSLYELSLPDAMPKVIINEAVELAKRFGDETDSKFINGVLGNFVRNQIP